MQRKVELFFTLLHAFKISHLDHVNLIKSFTPKCTSMQKIAQQMKKDKNACISTFSRCKKAEDATVQLIGVCMNFDTQDLNQTQIAAEAGSKVIG